MSTTTQNEEPIEDVLGEDKKQSLIKLRELVKESSELSPFQEDAQLLQFLYFTSFDVTKAIEKIKLFRNSLIKYPKWFAGKPPLEVKSVIEGNAVCLLESRDKQGRAIIVLKVANLDTNLPLEDSVRLFELIFDYAHMQSKTRENGLSVIMDMENVPWTILSWLTPRNITTEVELINCYACKEIIIHIVKTSVILDIGISIVWPFLPANIKEMIKFHYSNWSSLHEHINPENLPSEYGGTQPDISFDYYNQKLYQHNDEIKKRLKYRKAVWKIED